MRLSRTLCAVIGGFLPRLTLKRSGLVLSISLLSFCNKLVNVAGLSRNVWSFFTKSCPSSMLAKPTWNCRSRANSGASETSDLLVCEWSPLDEDGEDVVGVWSVEVDSEVSEVMANVIDQMVDNSLCRSLNWSQGRQECLVLCGDVRLEP